MRRAPVVPSALSSALLAVALVGCGGAPPSVEQEELEQRVLEHVESETGVLPDDATCPGQLRGEVGNQTECLIAIEDVVDVSVEVEVVEVTGDSPDDVELGFEIADLEDLPPTE